MTSTIMNIETDPTFTDKLLKFFKTEGSDLCSDFMNEETYTPDDKYLDEDTAKDYKKTGTVAADSVEHVGGMEQGSEYFCVVKFTNEEGKLALLKFDGFYASHYGSEFHDVFAVKPRETTVIVYDVA